MDKLRYSVSKLFLQGITSILMCVSILLGASYILDYGFVFILGFVCLLLLIINANFHYKVLGKIDLFSPGVAFPLAYITIISIGLITINLGIGYSYTAKVTPRVLYYYLIGLLCYICGNLLALLLFSRMRKIYWEKIINTWSMKKIFEWSLIIIVVGSIGAFIYYSKMKIPLFGDVDKIRHGFQGRLYGVGFSLQLLQGLNVILLIYLVYKHKAHFLKWMIVPILWISILSLLSGYRWTCVLFIFIPIVGYNYIIKKLKFNFRAIVTISMILIISLSFIGFLGRYRSVTKPGGTYRYLYNLEVMNISSKFSYFAPALLALQHPVSNFSKLQALVPIKYNYFYGTYCLATVPILPRIFPSLSRENIGYFVTNTIFGQDYRAGIGGTALSIVGSLYIDYGLSGIVFGMILIGFFIEMIYLSLVKTPSLLKVAVYSCLLGILITWIVSGIYVGALLIPLMVLAINKLIRKKHRSIRLNYENYPTNTQNALKL